MPTFSVSGAEAPGSTLPSGVVMPPPMLTIVTRKATDMASSRKRTQRLVLTDHRVRGRTGEGMLLPTPPQSTPS